MYSYENDIEQCLRVLHTGGLILYPTDTVWGIGCDATNEDAVAKVYALKKRSDEKSMIILLADERDIIKYVTQPDPRVYDYIKGIHKPTTIIYEGAVGLAPNLTPQNNSIAIRIVRDRFCKDLVKRFRKPVVSTSANVSGYPAPGVFTDIDIEIKNGVDYIVQHRQDDQTPAVPSAVVKWNVDGSLNIIRP
ncbi:MAG TPA: L-threonylcarbamoyladenylate synthase [Ferruginibacter sp.]|jgi:L-threonylcarbamoyladenylate synthase|nr:L-threonylcarbamoyladenylate synthase [Ferruginibacter sp.]HNA17910.1 L-threonylcarbamoyladenylate synthase [Ferruginibacter sp.]HNG63460.1 L-threonylcarbamoyladenylate synthase [Ferruginibacter sp.]HNJ28904.1 L-threonylcarbamoyladenylate synthase [Ferruginibacter sp.]HNK28589.1 L-threonylcarbamoyladenylate synthase [Ferruginibacter sp.]